MAEHVDAPGTAPVVDRRPVPRGVLPRGVQTWLMAGLAIVNLATGGPWWVLWVLLGWGLGVLAHALTVFGHTSRAVADWEQRKLRQYLDEG